MPMEREKAPMGWRGLFEVIRASCHAVASAASALLETEMLKRLSTEQLDGLSKMLDSSMASLNKTVFRLQEEISAQLSKHKERASQQNSDSRTQYSGEQQKTEPRAEPKEESRAESVIYAGEASPEAVKQAENENKQTDTQSKQEADKTADEQEEIKPDKNVAGQTDKTTGKMIEKPKEIEEILKNGIAQMTDSDKYRDFLNTAAKFPKYSLNNIMLIAMQKPGATELASFKTWKENFGRNVNRGEKGIRIIVPYIQKAAEERIKLDPKTKLPVLDSNGKPVTEKTEVAKPKFKAVSVFDVSQTNGRERPPSELDKFRVSQNNTKQLRKLKSSIMEAAKYELAKRGGKGSLKEAEAITYAVCRRYGIEAQEYRIDGMSGRSEHEIREALELVRDVTAELTKQLDEQMRERLEQERRSADDRKQVMEREQIERRKQDEKELQQKEKITKEAVAAAFSAALDNSVSASAEKQQDRAWENGAETVGEKISENAAYVNISSAPQSTIPQNSKGAEPKQAAKSNTAQQSRSSAARSERRGSTYKVSEKNLGQRSSVRDRLKNNIQKVNEGRTREQHSHRTSEISIG
ncbi:MAG: ArdC family protein [bacterium]|nr:ArdC family protein [bacterium]